MTYFIKFIESLNKLDSALAEKVELLFTRGRPCELAAKNIFEPAEAQDIEYILSKVPSVVNNQQTLVWPLVSTVFNSKKYLPIRAFRSDPASTWDAVDKLRIFMSSGTSSSPEGRSRSCFSEDGLLFYRAGSIAAFFGILETRTASFSGDNLNTVTVSLIPKKSIWPDSSLAQMVAWISEIWKTYYPENEEHLKIVECLDNALKLNSPLVIFGTAFHFVNLLDSGIKFQLPKGSIVIETGGTKGRSRNIARADLYHLISQGFGIDPSDIVSEYGMCEIATPAWDFVPLNQNIELKDRVFKFPWWVKAGTMTSTSQVNTTGDGALIIEDPLRIDLPSLAIQTEDLANLNADGSFSVIGRVPKAPLKGCSLRVKDISSDHSIFTKSRMTGSKPLRLVNDNLMLRAKNSIEWILDLCASQTSLNILAEEFGSKVAAQNALNDLRNGIPNSIDDLVKGALLSLGIKSFPQEGLAVENKWLLIAPANHSLALIHPLLAAYILGFNLRIRIPEIAGISADNTFLAFAVQELKKFNFAPTILDKSWRLGHEDLLDDERVLIFGDDDTCDFVEHFSNNRASSFSRAISTVIASRPDLNSQKLLNGIWIDLTHLRQRGCLSARALFIIGGELTEISNIIEDSIKLSFENEKDKHFILNNGELAARSLEHVRYIQMGYTGIATNEDENCPSNVFIKKITLNDIPEVVLHGMSQLDLVIPIFILPEYTTENLIIHELAKYAPLKAISLNRSRFLNFEQIQNSPNLPQSLRVVIFGSLGVPRFDGTHLGKSFFTVGFGNKE